MEQTTKCSQTLRPAFSKQVLRMHSLNSQLGCPPQWHQGFHQRCCVSLARSSLTNTTGTSRNCPQEDIGPRNLSKLSPRFVKYLCRPDKIFTDRSARGAQPSDRIDDELETNLRELIRLDNEIVGLLKSSEGDNDISTQINILSALRSSDDTPTSASRATSVGKSRDRQGKRKVTDSLDDRDSIAADSPGPSPKVVISQKDKLIAKSTSSRAGSVPAGREGSVKAEDDENGKGKKGRSSIPRSSSSSSKRGFVR